jgi:hypothetical protein
LRLATEHILKDASRQRHPVELSIFPDTSAHPSDQVNHSEMKFCRNNLWENAVQYVFHGRANHILGAYHTPIIGNVKLISLPAITVGDLFQLNRGLAFVVGCVAQTKQA